MKEKRRPPCRWPQQPERPQTDFLDREIFGKERVALFDFARGSGVMGPARHTLAYLHPGLWPICRDADAESFRCEVIILAKK